ncbi:helix-turn-helix domain-containing protein [Streptomyces sp. NPDC101150]|uniref:helix-turn-helix domain-containing protein n=1 Tax=Streptomyces sp. NPDC101150 TaxID=3366114 RepID=UPI00382D6476
MFDCWGEPRRPAGGGRNLDPVSQTEQAAAIAMYRGGATLSEVAEKYGISRQTLRRRFVRWGEPTRKRGETRSLRRSKDLGRCIWIQDLRRSPESRCQKERESGKLYCLDHMSEVDGDYVPVRRE